MAVGDTNCDVAIIGAGPAGSTAAISLAREGRQVVLVEKGRFPREKACGGCLSGTATTLLERIIADGCPMPGIPGKTITFVMGSCRLVCSPQERTRIVVRSELDACLAQLAASEGADVRFGRYATLTRGDMGWEVAVGDERITAGHVLIASGIGRLPTLIGITGKPRRRRLISQQWVQPAGGPLPQLGDLELHWLWGGYVGLATPRENHCVVAIAAEAQDLKGQNALERLHRLNPRAPIMQALHSDAPLRYGSKGCAGFPWMPNLLGVDNVLLIGDAAGYEEPYSGMGMGQAMCSGLYAAEAILAGGDVVGRYTTLMRRHHQPVLRRTRLISRVLRTPFMYQVTTRLPLLPSVLLRRLIERVHVRSAA